MPWICKREYAQWTGLQTLPARASRRPHATALHGFKVIQMAALPWDQALEQQTRHVIRIPVRASVVLTRTIANVVGTRTAAAVVDLCPNVMERILLWHGHDRVIGFRHAMNRHCPQLLAKSLREDCVAHTWLPESVGLGDLVARPVQVEERKSCHGAPEAMPCNQ